jgi:hypothetical protein
MLVQGGCYFKMIGKNKREVIMMHSNQNNVEEIVNALKAWDDQQILISREENGNLDQTVITLNDISIDDHGETIDGYVSPVSLLLEGNGRAVMEDTDVPMPSSTYDIPIDQVYDAHFDGIRLFVTTDRGSYTITRL